jgi:hypothetical protein
MSQRKDSYRAALRRNPGTSPSPSGIVIRTKPVSVTIDLDPGVRRMLTRLARYPVALRPANLRSAAPDAAIAGVLRTFGRQLSRVRRPGGHR